MSNSKSWRLTVAIAAVAAVILPAGGVAIASNMGFKMNFPLYSYNNPGCLNCGSNLVSIPYFNPYVGAPCTTPAGTSCAAQLCTQLGLPGGLGGTLVTFLNESATSPSTCNLGSGSCTGFGISATCGTASANAFRLWPGKAYMIRP